MAWIERIKNIFCNKEKRVENLVSFLIILIITLIFINKILKDDDSTKKTDYVNETGVELASSENVKTSSDELEKKLEKNY